MIRFSQWIDNDIEVDSEREWINRGRMMADGNAGLNQGEWSASEAPGLSASPVLLHPILKSQTLILEPTIPEGYYFIFCKLEDHFDPTRSVEYLKQLMMDSPRVLYSAKRANPIVLHAQEMAAVKSVSCLVQNVHGEFYKPIVISMPLDVAEESPEIDTLVSDVNVNSLSYIVSVSIPAYLWCSVYRSDEYPPSVQELMRKKVLFVRDKASFSQSNLIPNTEYSIYCYAESIRGSPMKELLSDVRVSTTTKECLYICMLL